MDQFLRSLVIAVAVAFIAPVLIQVIRIALGAGTFTVAAVFAPVKKLFWGIVKVGKYISIPIASIILFAPDSMRTMFPESSTILGICVLIVASVYLLYAMFGGLRQALAISFWALICVVVVCAFQLDSWLPQQQKRKVAAKFEKIGDGKFAPIANEVKKSKTQSNSDDLEVSSFSLPKPTQLPAENIENQKTSAHQSEDVFSKIEQWIKDSVAPLVAWFEPKKDQSFKGLPSEMYFDKKRGEKKQRYGFSGGESEDAGDPLTGFVTGFFKE